MKLRLDSGTEVALVELRQSLEYEGLSEGLPTREINRRAIEALVEKESSRGVGTFVIEPKQEPIEHDGRYPFGDPARLPSVRCIGRFQSREPTEAGANYSEVTVLWWQDEFGLPSDDAVLLALRRMDWAKYARDQTY